MAINISVNTPLTAVQSELAGKIGSMQSLMSIIGITFPTIPKSQQMSAYDYLLKILELMGVNPKFLFEVFIAQVFDENIMVEKILVVFAKMSANKGRNLQSSSITTNPNESTRKLLEEANLAFLRSKLQGPMRQVFRAAKMVMAQQLAMMIFGRQSNQSSNDYLAGSTDPVVQERILSEAVCGAELFSLSNNPSVKDEDLEYNRIQLLQQIEKGQVKYKISCQNVEISLPEDPKFIFEGGGMSTIPGSPTNDPAKSITRMIDHVGNQVQNKNAGKNADSAANAFSKNVIEKIIQYAPTLFRPMFSQVFTFMNTIVGIGSTPAEQQAYYGYDEATMTSSSCDILNDPGDEDKKDLATNLCNILLQILIGILLTFLIGKIKKLAKDYFARKAIEKLKRKQAKLTQRFKIIDSIKDAADKASKAIRLQQALAVLSHLLPSENN